MAEEIINLSEIAGPIYLGILLNWTLYGVLVVQVYIYWVAFEKDRKTVKCLVYGLFLLDTLQSLLLARDGFITFGTGFGRIEGLNEAHLEWLSVPLMTALVSCIVQCFFASRIYILSEKSYWIPGTIVVTSLTQGIAAAVAGIKDLQLQKYSLLQTHAVVEITIWHVATAMCDTLIATSMCYYLYTRDTKIQHTHEVIVKLIQLTIETGTATATVAVVDLILFLAAPGKIYFIAPSFIATKLYANTIVVIFNNRAQIVTSQQAAEQVASQGERSFSGRRLTNHINFASGAGCDGNNRMTGVEIQKSAELV